MKRRSFELALCVALAMVLLPASSRAQTISTGTLIGTISDDEGRPLNDVSVTLLALHGGASRSAITSGTGEYRFSLLLPGDYTVIVERLGYRPVQIEDVPIRPGRRVRVDASIKVSAPPVSAAERIRFAGDPGATRPAMSRSLSTLSLTRLPWEDRDATEIAGLASNATSSLQVEGLPGWLSAITVDGIPYTAARHPALARYTQRDVALPIGVIQSAELVTADPDVEWSGFAGGALALNTRRGSSNVRAETFGSWAGSALRQSKYIDDTNVASSSMWGGLLIEGPIVRDTSHFVIGLEARRVNSPLPRAWQRDAALDATLVSIGESAFNVDLGRYTRPYALQSDVVSGFARFDWQLSNENAFSVRAGAGRISRPAGDAGIAAAMLPELLADGNDLFMSAALETRLAGRWAHEIRAGFVSSTRGYDAGEWPSTHVAANRVGFGSDERLPAEFQRTDLTLDQSIQFRSTRHHLKGGMAVGAGWHKTSYARTSAAEFMFGSPTEFGQTAGTFVEAAVNTSVVDFNVVKFGAFLQDFWNAGPGLEVKVGLRYDLATLPNKDISLSQEWLIATGLSSNAVKGHVGTVSPRFALTWDLAGDARWLVTASGGRYAGEPDAGILNEALIADGDLRVRRAVGDLGGWPSPAAANLSSYRTALTILGDGYQPPQSNRATLGLSHRVGATVLHLSGAYRYTDHLPRRADINMFATPAMRDQYGRAIYGTPSQIGELITATPARRFDDFDMVSAISSDGWSRYWGVTAGVEHDNGGPLAFFANYTRSRTRDTWPTDAAGVLSQSQLSPFPDEGTGDWREGVSDFDLPDRVAAGIELRPRVALQPRLLAVYRYRSGYPFTPGFPDGVDINADGSGRNDPAFIDSSVSGAAEVLGSWSCLEKQVGRFAERNSCRSSGVHSLNVRVGLSLLHSAGAAAEVFVDGINLIESEIAEPDRALYLIDSARSLVIDQASGNAVIPLIANPRFGEPLVRYGNGRLLRIGIQVNY